MLRSKRHLAIALLVIFSCAKKTPPPEEKKVETPAAEKKPETKTGPAKEPKKTELELAKDLPPIPDSEKWRDVIPRSENRQPRLPAFKSSKLKNGLTLIVPAEKSLLPIVAFQLVTRGGSALDTPDKAGVTALVYAMLSEGAGKRDALQYSDAVADLGANFVAASDRDRGSASIGGLSRNSDAMVALLAEASLSPKMEAKDFERRKSQQLAALIAARGSPDGLAFQAIPPLIYGKDHPYGHPPTGTPETVQPITLDDVKKALPRVIAPERSALIAVGDITLEDLTKLAEKHFGKWKGAQTPMAEIAPVEVKPRNEVVVINKNNSPQTMTLVGRAIFGRGDPDEAAMTVTNAVYGGTFTSRLNMNLREDKGYTYGAGSQSQYRIGAGVFLAFSAIRADVTAPGLSEFFKELDGMVKKPPTDDEVDLAKNGLILALPGQFERATAAAGAAASIYVYDLPLDYYVGLVERIEAVDPSKVEEMAKKHLDPKLMTVLLVGEAPKIKDDVEKLGLGKVEVRQQ